jgi:hypothetical protein
MASSMYIEGGYLNYIENCKFIGNVADYERYLIWSASELIHYFPKDYFNYQSASLIQIHIEPEIESSSTYTSNVIFSKCQFKENFHIQVIGLSDTQKYMGSLISYKSSYSDNPSLLPFL